LSAAKSGGGGTVTAKTHRPSRRSDVLGVAGIDHVGRPAGALAERGGGLLKRFFRLNKVIPCHYGSFPIVDATADKFIVEMKRTRHGSRGAGEGPAGDGVTRM
jgi:hypothetical protein